MYSPRYTLLPRAPRTDSKLWLWWWEPLHLLPVPPHWKARLRAGRCSHLLAPMAASEGTGRVQRPSAITSVFVVCLRYAILCDTVINKPAPVARCRLRVVLPGRGPTPGPWESSKRAAGASGCCGPGREGEALEKASAAAPGRAPQLQAGLPAAGRVPRCRPQRRPLPAAPPEAGPSPWQPPAPGVVRSDASVTPAEVTRGAAGGAAVPVCARRCLLLLSHGSGSASPRRHVRPRQRRRVREPAEEVQARLPGRAER